jgi:serine/threonine protein kinase
MRFTLRPAPALRAPAEHPSGRHAIVDNSAVGKPFRPSLLSMTFVAGDYRAIELIGAGGSARVWRGELMATGAPVALKVFRPDQLPMVRREAALAAAVDHPHVVKVIEVVGDDERAVLVTELASGGDLADLLGRRGRLSPGETLTVLLPLAAALATAHEREIVHGDLSAQNILFDRAGRPLLADLGAGRAAAEGGGPVAATPTDAAPELARGGTPCAATDMFSLGSLALACLTGRHAWPADDLRDVLIQAAAGQWPGPADADGPPLLISAVRALLEHDPERRPRAASLVMDLRAAGRPEPLDLRLGTDPPRRAATGTVSSGARRLDRDQAFGEPASAASPATGRHGLPVESVRPVPNIEPGRDQRDLGRLGRARAVTRIRSDTPAPPTPAQQSRLQRVRSLARPGAGGAGPTPDPGRPGRRSSRRRAVRRRAARFVVLAIATLIVAGLAGAGGLWWARWDRTDPVALDRPSSPAPVTISAPVATSASGSAASTVNPQAPSPTPAPVPPRRATPTTAESPSGAGSSVRSTSAQAAAVTTGPSRTTSTTSHSSSRPAAAGPTVVPGAIRRTGLTGPTPADFTKTVRDLDDARARALIARNTTLLDSVYTPASPARSVDAGTIASLLSGGLRLSGAAHVVRSARVVGAAPLRVEVDDSLPSYLVLDAGGSIVGNTESRAVSARVMVLVETPAGYRISAVQQR